MAGQSAGLPGFGEGGAILSSSGCWQIKAFHAATPSCGNCRGVATNAHYSLRCVRLQRPKFVDMGACTACMNASNPGALSPLRALGSASYSSRGRRRPPRVWATVLCCSPPISMQCLQLFNQLSTCQPHPTAHVSPGDSEWSTNNHRAHALYMLPPGSERVISTDSQAIKAHCVPAP